MGVSTFRAKFVPLSQLDRIEKIFVVRRNPGPKIPKVEYIVLPGICKLSIFHLIVSPIILTYYTVKKKADIILTYHFIPYLLFGFFASKMTKKPHIFCQTGSICQHYIERKCLRRITKSLLNSLSAFNVPGMQTLEYWVNHGINTDKIRVLHSTIDTEKFSSRDVEKKFDFIYIGELGSHKRVDKIITAFSQIVKSGTEASLAIVGTGKDEDQLKTLVRSLQVENSVEFFGYQKDVVEFLVLAKIFVMFSKAEGLPVALMEAMSTELLVIAPDVNNIPGMLKNNVSGYLVESGNFQELFEKMNYALTNYHNLNHLRKNAREEIVTNHSYGVAVRKLEMLFARLT